MSKLSQIADAERKIELARKSYQEDKPYSATHKNALSDGDEHGKGETTTVGSVTDMTERAKGVAKNTYNQNKPYDHSAL